MSFPRCWPLAVLYHVLVLLLGAASARRSAGSGSSSSGSKLLLRIPEFDNCEGPRLPIHLIDRNIKWYPGEGHFVDAVVEISRLIKSFKVGIFYINRCRDAKRLDLCEYYATWAWKRGICNLLEMPGMMWTKLVQTVSPSLTCPLKPGTYRSWNSTWDLDNGLVKQIMGDGMVWKGDLKITDSNNVTVACLRGAVQGVREGHRPVH